MWFNIIPMTPEAIFEEPYQEKETWGICNQHEWAVINAAEARRWNEYTNKVQRDGDKSEYIQYLQSDPADLETPVAFRCNIENFPNFMMGPTAIFEGAALFAVTRKMSLEEFETMIYNHGSKIFIYRVYRRGAEDLIRVRMCYADE
jgi:hypothetical protein